MVATVRWREVSYPLGWSLTTRIGVRRERWPGGYDAKAIPLVSVGTYVEPDQPVMHLKKTAEANAPVMVPRLSLPSAVEPHLPGTASRRLSLENETIMAGLRGRVIAVTGRGGVVIEGLAAIVAGTLGAGKQVAGPLVIWQAASIAQDQERVLAGAILVVPGPLNLAMLLQALNAGSVGVVASSISSRDLERFLRIDLIDLLHCTNVDLLLAQLPPLTVMLTEGLGTVAMPTRTINLLSKYQGVIALLSGATSVSAKVYPELVIPLSRQERAGNQPSTMPDTTLRPGALVRVCSGSYEGAIGKINYVFSHQQLFPSGIRARAARLTLEDGSQLVAPLPVLERIG